MRDGLTIELGRNSFLGVLGAENYLTQDLLSQKDHNKGAGKISKVYFIKDFRGQNDTFKKRRGRWTRFFERFGCSPKLHFDDIHSPG